MDRFVAISLLEDLQHRPPPESPFWGGIVSENQNTDDPITAGEAFSSIIDDDIERKEARATAVFHLPALAKKMGKRWTDAELIPFLLRSVEEDDEILSFAIARALPALGGVANVEVVGNLPKHICSVPPFDDSPIAVAREYLIPVILALCSCSSETVRNFVADVVIPLLSFGVPFYCYFSEPISLSLDTDDVDDPFTHITRRKNVQKVVELACASLEVPEIEPEKCFFSVVCDYLTGGGQGKTYPWPIQVAAALRAISNLLRASRDVKGDSDSIVFNRTEEQRYLSNAFFSSSKNTRISQTINHCLNLLQQTVFVSRAGDDNYLPESLSKTNQYDIREEYSSQSHNVEERVLQDTDINPFVRGTSAVKCRELCRLRCPLAVAVVAAALDVLPHITRDNDSHLYLSVKESCAILFDVVALPQFRYASGPSKTKEEVSPSMQQHLLNDQEVKQMAYQHVISLFRSRSVASHFFEIIAKATNALSDILCHLPLESQSNNEHRLKDLQYLLLLFQKGLIEGCQSYIQWKGRFTLMQHLPRILQSILEAVHKILIPLIVENRSEVLNRECLKTLIGLQHALVATVTALKRMTSYEEEPEEEVRIIALKTCRIVFSQSSDCVLFRLFVLYDKYRSIFETTSVNTNSQGKLLALPVSEVLTHIIDICNNVIAAGQISPLDTERSMGHIPQLICELLLICSSTVDLDEKKKLWTKTQCMHSLCSLVQDPSTLIQLSVVESLVELSHGFRRQKGPNQVLADETRELVLLLCNNLISSSMWRVRESFSIAIMKMMKAFVFPALKVVANSKKFTNTVEMRKKCYDNEKYFRNTISKQLRDKKADPLVETQYLFGVESLAPFVIRLLFDKVYSVRQSALSALTENFIDKSALQCILPLFVDFELYINSIEKTPANYALSRETYLMRVALLHLLVKIEVNVELFLCPILEEFAKDPIDNVRLAIAKILSEMLQSPSRLSPALKEWIAGDSVLKPLIGDRSADVREMAAEAFSRCV
eukprot:Tbor_TRINITY_DN3488_c0_g2::TRINITY_DN3488_c0_g2_i1::g.3763::m.3763